jgi:endonuclease/exonuclease/phosphatase family metal-dependent hydrolase
MTRIMRALSLVWLVALLAGCNVLGNKASNESNGRTIRVMTYNIHHAVGLDEKLDLGRIADVIKKQKPDLVAIQEVDKGVNRSQKKDEAAEIGKLAGMYSFFGKATDWDGGDYGQCVLSRWPIKSSKVMRLPNQDGREQRIGVMIRVKPPSAKLPEIVFVGTHLEHQVQDLRVAQAKQLKADLDSIPSRSIILAGDFNAKGDNPAVEVFAKDGWVNASGKDETFPAPLPNRKIDWIFIRQDGPWKVRSADVPAERIASDHRPVVVELEWKGD